MVEVLVVGAGRAGLAREALPRQDPPMNRLRKQVRLEPGLYVCGDHRDSASIQGALVSGRRAATAMLAELTVTVGPQAAGAG